MDMPVTVQGTLKPDGTLDLAQKLTLPPGQVTVTIQPAGPAAPSGRGLADVIDEIRKGQQARGFQGRGAEEIEAARQEGDDEYEKRMQALQAQSKSGPSAGSA